MLCSSPSSSLTTTSQQLHCSYYPMDEPLALLESVYGPVEHADFPRPMPADEAGLCADGRQGRYLWTDAFGVLAYTSLADRCQHQGRTVEAGKYKRAADKLVNVVHDCLGSPRSLDEDHTMTSNAASPTGHVGLRIGKVDSRKVTDCGMKYDGQYWHYIDKWLLALARSGHVDQGIQIAKTCFPYFFDAGRHGTGQGGGMRWKLNVDASAPPSLQYASASDDTLVALIVFSILEAHRSSTDNAPSLVSEIKLLQTSLRGYQPRATDDPLGWGLEAMFDEFLQGHPRRAALQRLAPNILDPSHLSIPFRLYGAMMGARLMTSDGSGATTYTNNVTLQQKVDKLVALSLQHEARVAGREEHASINRVMLAMVMLCPGTLGKRPDDPLVSI